MTNILNGGDEPSQDDDWADFLSQPMSTLVADTEVGANASAGFRDRYNLAMRFVFLLGVTVIVGLGLFALTQRSEKILVADDGETSGEVVEEPSEDTEPVVDPDPDPESEPTTTTITTTTTEPPTAEVPGVVDTSRYEFVMQIDDAEGPFWYVLDKEANTRLWAAECLNELGTPDREILWPELSTYAEPESFTECVDLVPLIENRPAIDPDASTEQAADTSRYEFVMQTDDAEGPFWYVLDKEANTRLWAAECLEELGEPDREILFPELSTYAEPESFTECVDLVPLVQNR